MRIAVCLAIAAVGCGAPQYRHARVDPGLADATSDAITAWQEATGWRFPPLPVAFVVGPTYGRAALTEHGDDGSTITVDGAAPPGMLRRILIHELGHVARLRFDEDRPDPLHFHGGAPSVMKTELGQLADEISAADLAAFDRQYGR